MLQFVGDRLTKIEAERNEVLERPLAIKTQVNTTGVESKDLFVAGDKKPGLTFDYTFEAQYGEKTGKIAISGQILAVGTDEELKKIEKEWKKKKKLESDLVIPVLNRALELSYLQTLPLAKELRLPIPFKLPRFEKEHIEEEKK